MVELRGFEPLTSAVRHPRFTFQPLRFHAAIDKEKWRESHFAVIANGELRRRPAAVRFAQIPVIARGCAEWVKSTRCDASRRSCGDFGPRLQKSQGRGPYAEFAMTESLIQSPVAVKFLTQC